MSTLTIDPPIVGGLPPLPPFLQPKRRGRRWIILPDICRCETMDTIFDRSNNWKTDIYRWMCRIDSESGSFVNVNVNVNTRMYRQWLETYQTEDGIPPHISFGGAIVAGEGDPTFHSRWKEYALATFC